MTRKTWGLLIPLCMGFVEMGAAQSAPKTQLTARELFYAAVEAPKPAPAKPQARPAPHKAAPAPRPAAETTRPRRQATPAPVPERRAPQEGIVQLAAEHTTAPAPTAGPALGLKYSILKLDGSEMVEVPATTVFHAGDKIQFNIQTNLPGYLYIISQGSSGMWKPMFPSRDVDDGDNHVDGWHTYTMPPNSRIVFDQQTGTEKIFIVFSREPETDLENMIYSLKGERAKPAAAPRENETPRVKTMVAMASANIDDSMVGRLRTTYSRDLIIEKVDPNTPGEKKETAVYVVNPTGSSDSRVVADLALVHQ